MIELAVNLGIILGLSFALFLLKVAAIGPLVIRGQHPLKDHADKHNGRPARDCRAPRRAFSWLWALLHIISSMH